MKIVGFILITVIVAALVLFIYTTIKPDDSIVSPVPERSGIRVIETPIVSPSK
jgi:hypothetical protein